MYFSLGQAYYFATFDSKLDSLTKRSFLISADSAFSKVNVAKPDYTKAFFYRAGARSKLDPESTAGLAKPQYEMVVKLYEAPSNKSFYEALKNLKKESYNQIIKNYESYADAIKNSQPSEVIDKLYNSYVESIKTLDDIVVKDLYKKTFEKNRDGLIEAYQYLGYYFYLQKDNTKSKYYWEKLLMLDPNDKQAKDVLKVIK